MARVICIGGKYVPCSSTSLVIKGRNFECSEPYDGPFQINPDLNQLQELGSLDIVETKITDIPFSIRELARLKALRLSHNNEILELPDQSTESNLEILSVKNCKSFMSLPLIQSSFLSHLVSTNCKI